MIHEGAFLVIQHIRKSLMVCSPLGKYKSLRSFGGDFDLRGSLCWCVVH